MRAKLVISILLACPTVFAQSAFDGTWHFTAESAQISGNNDKYSLVNGTYRCDSCNPKQEAKADGHDHPLSGSPYADSINIRPISDHAVEIVEKKAGKPTFHEKMTVSADGRTLTTEWENILANGQKATGTYVESRVGDAPRNAMLANSNSQPFNKITGEWKQDKIQAASANIMTYTYKMTNDAFSMSSPQGTSYEVKLDGRDAPYNGYPGIETVSVKKIDANTVEETDKRDGKVVGVVRLSVDPEGKHLKVNYEDKLQGNTFTSTAEKQ